MTIPIIIVGAARSGTNMLRDVLVQLPEYSTWPCDEINYIWRYGNRAHPHDEFTRDMATAEAKSYIQGAVKHINNKAPDTTVIEKTCATSLRVGFVDEIFPEARFLHIYRDGRAVAASAALRWNASLEPRYLFQKGRFVPKRDLVFYAQRYFNSRLHKLRTGEQRLSTWGPKFKNMDEVFQKYELPVACAIQWMKCVESSRSQLTELPPERVYSLSYEDFISEPAVELEKLCTFLGTAPGRGILDNLNNTVSAGSLGKWKEQLTQDQLIEIEQLAGNTLERMGYSLSGNELELTE